ncbi:MAG: hypothetical protein ACAI38_17970 [Myxococcota bacterium]
MRLNSAFALLFPFVLPLVLVSGCGTDPLTGEEGLPAFDAPAVNVGALMCVTGDISAKASGLERSVKLAEELVNGSVRAFPDVDEDDIPCRARGNCGVWAGRDSSGTTLRAPIKVIVADTEQDTQTAVATATSLVEDYEVPIIIGPCTADEMESVFTNVTGTSTSLISPVVTSDSISKLPDRTAQDTVSQLPGYVYRLIVADYVQMNVLATVGTNTEARGKVLFRAEDRTEDECTAAPTATYCESKYGAQYSCQRNFALAEPEKDFYQQTEESCGGEAEGFCDKLGANFECVDGICQRFRERRYCTLTTQPRSAMVIYEDSAFGRSLLTDVEDTWVGARDRIILSRVAFDPTNPIAFNQNIQDLFEAGRAGLDASITAGDLPANYDFADTVVFIFARATEAALLMQEWQLQTASLPTGSDRVFWMGTDLVRSQLVVDQLGSNTIRNLFSVDPYTLAPDRSFFPDLYAARWGQPPDQYSGNAFDAVVLSALAIERAGWQRARSQSGPLDQSAASQIKNSIQPVSLGCITQILPNPQTILCTNPVSGFAADELASAKTALSAGTEIKLLGASGNLALSPAGDVLNTVQIWKIASQGSKRGFYQVSTVEPGNVGAILRE